MILWMTIISSPCYCTDKNIKFSGVIILNYEKLLMESDSHGLIVKEKALKYNDGRIKGNRIAIRKDMTSIEKACVLSEELGHHYTTTGNILDMNNPVNRKQEQRARAWAYNKMIGLMGIAKSYEHGCHSLHETADFLNVTEDFLEEALIYYRSKYGVCTTVGNYIIYFEPSLGVGKLI